MNDPNREQIEFWNRLGRRWAIYQERLDRVWRPLGDTAIDRAAVQPGECVIDVGCGCGATTLELATRAGSKGSAIGVDVSAPMLQRARERAQAAGVTNLAFIQADSSAYKFSNDADLIFSRTGVMFFSDTVAAFANLRRALRPGGRLVLSASVTANSIRGGRFRSRQLRPWSPLRLRHRRANPARSLSQRKLLARDP
jgi:ubiquinone/menaquinone biosynthesis C-methylase UbiE